jgi:predicted DNA-binding transcriptional regulator YafY
MRRAERLFRLVAELRRRGVSRAEDLAASLEVSERTVYRDIAHLQGSGLPIEGAAGVGYLLRPGFDLPSLTFTFDQLEALATGAAFVIAAGDPDLAEAARQARAKIEAALPPERGAALSASPFLATRRDEVRAPGLAAVLRRAIRERTILDLIYRDGAGVLTGRRMRPLALTSFTDGWLLGGWCELRQALRDFRLDRIEAATPADRTFEPEPGRDLAAYRALHAEP